MIAWGDALAPGTTAVLHSGVFDWFPQGSEVDLSVQPRTAASRYGLLPYVTSRNAANKTSKALGQPPATDPPFF